MKTSRILYIVALAGVAWLALSFGMRNLDLQRELDRQQKVSAAQRRAVAGTPNLGVLEREVQDLERQMAAATQRLYRVETQYEEERSTHEPLRAQIEKMNAEALRHNREAAQNQERLQQLQKAVAEGETKQRTTLAEHQAVVAEKQDLLNRLKNTEAEKQKGLETQADLRTRLAATEQQMAGLSNDVAVTRANLEDAFRNISELMSRLRVLGGLPQ